MKNATQAKLIFNDSDSRQMDQVEMLYCSIASIIKETILSPSVPPETKAHGSKLNTHIIAILKGRGIDYHASTVYMICDIYSRSWHMHKCKLIQQGIQPLVFRLENPFTGILAIKIPYLHKYVELSQPMDTGRIVQLIHVGDNWYLQRFAEDIQPAKTSCQTPQSANNAVQSPTPAALSPDEQLLVDHFLKPYKKKYRDFAGHDFRGKITPKKVYAIIQAIVDLDDHNYDPDIFINWVFDEYEQTNPGLNLAEIGMVVRQPVIDKFLMDNKGVIDQKRSQRKYRERQNDLRYRCKEIISCPHGIPENEIGLFKDCMIAYSKGLISLDDMEQAIIETEKKYNIVHSWA